MKHPLSSFGYYSGSADFDRSGIDNVSADFSSGNVVNASEDFGKQCMSGDFGVDYGEDYFQGGFEGYGHFDHFLGDYDEGLGRKNKKLSGIKKPKIKIKPSIKGIKLPKQALKIQEQALKKAKDMAKIAKIVPNIPQVQALAQKAAQAISKTGIPVEAIAPALSPLLSPKATVKAQAESSISDESQEIVAPVQQASSVVSPEQARTSTPEVKVNGQYAHPLLFTNRRMKGEALSGFLDDLMAAQKTAVQKAIDTNKAKLTAAATTQLSNIVGKQLDKLSKSDPKATAAIQNVVAQATETATAKAKEGIAETLKASFEQNKKYIMIVGGGILALVAYKMYMKKKA